MFSLAKNVVKARNGFFTKKDKHQDVSDIMEDENSLNNVRTLEKMAKDERNNKDIPEDKYFFNKLNDIFQKFLGSTIRRQYNYFLAENFVEEGILKSLDTIDQEELSDYAIKILRKDMDKRLFEEIIILQKVTENVEAFKHIRVIKGREVLFTCLKNLKYKYGKMGTHIQKQNEPVRSLYIVIKGLVQIKTVALKDLNTPKRSSIVGNFQNAAQRQLERKDSTIRLIKNQQQLRQAQNKLGKIEKKYSFQECLDELNTQGKQKCTYLNKGQSYGDKYILAQDDALAENQAYLFDNSHLAYLDIIKFKTILDERVLQKLQKEIAEFSEMNIINALEQKFVAALYVRTKIVTFKRNNILTTESEKAEFVYFIKEGELKLTKKLIYENQHDQNENQKKQAQSQTNFQIPHQSIQNYDLAILGKGQFIGLEEFLKEQRYQASSTIYSTEATLYQISRYEFQQILSINRSIRDQIMNYFESEQEIDRRQERVSNFNSYTGKIDTKSKLIEEQQEKLKSYRSEDDIKKNLLKGQDMIIKTNLNLMIKPQHANNNLEFIMQSINKENKYQSKKKNKQINYLGCQFSEDYLENLKRSTYVPSKSSMRFSQSTNESPLKTHTSVLKQGNESRSSVNLKSHISPSSQNIQNKKSLQHLEMKSSLFDFGTSQNAIKEKYPSTFTNIENDHDHTDPIKTSNGQQQFLTERASSMPFNHKKPTSKLFSNRYMKVKLDPIVIDQETQIDGKRNSEDLNNSIQVSELRSPQGNQSIEINSDGQAHNKLNLRLRLSNPKERKSIDAQDSSRYKSYFNDSTIQMPSTMFKSDPIQIKSFTQFTNIIPTNTSQEQFYNNDYIMTQNLNSSILKGQNSRRNSQQNLEIHGSPTKTSQQKINFNRIHNRLESLSTKNQFDKEGFSTQRSHSTKNQFLPLKYRINDIVESKNLFKTMYKDNQKRAKLQQQAKQLYKQTQNPYLDIQASYNS